MTPPLTMKYLKTLIDAQEERINQLTLQVRPVILGTQVGNATTAYKIPIATTGEVSTPDSGASVQAPVDPRYGPGAIVGWGGQRLPVVDWNQPAGTIFVSMPGQFTGDGQPNHHFPMIWNQKRQEGENWIDNITLLQAAPE